AAQTVFASGVPLVVVPLDATVDLKLDEAARRRIFAARTQLTWQLQALYQLWDKETPILFDPVATAVCFEERFCTFKEMCVDVDDKGLTHEIKVKPNARVAVSIRRDEFLQ